ncbi:MAG: VOC family protein [Cypionkella sp.]|jgi:hypothetical protein|nr:VOC family protein [Cypionkella sp.]
MSVHGLPFWYELTARDLPASAAFYGPVMGWAFQDAGVPGYDYSVALVGADMVAGMMRPDTAMPDVWMLYFAVDDCDAVAARVAALGGTVRRAPETIPGTGRFAIVTDPQGAEFGLMQPEDGQPGTAYAPMQPGRVNWHELMTDDPAAALAFYADLLGWTPGTKMDMGDMGLYHIFAAAPGEIGGMMADQTSGLPPRWIAVFGTDSVGAALARVTTQGGTPLMEPMEVPGGAYACYARDPQGAVFGLVGPP